MCFLLLNTSIHIFVCGLLFRICSPSCLRDSYQIQSNHDSEVQCVSGAPAECKQANYFFHLYLFLALYNSLVTVRISSVSSVCIITSSGRKMLHKKIRTTKRFVLNADNTKLMILSDSITGIVFSVRLFLVRAHTDLHYLKTVWGVIVFTHFFCFFKRFALNLQNKHLNLKLLPSGKSNSTNKT